MGVGSFDMEDSRLCFENDQLNYRQTQLCLLHSNNLSTETACFDPRGSKREDLYKTMTEIKYVIIRFLLYIRPDTGRLGPQHEA